MALFRRVAKLLDYPHPLPRYEEGVFTGYDKGAGRVWCELEMHGCTVGKFFFLHFIECHVYFVVDLQISVRFVAVSTIVPIWTRWPAGAPPSRWSFTASDLDRCAGGEIILRVCQ